MQAAQYTAQNSLLTNRSAQLQCILERLCRALPQACNDAIASVTATVVASLCDNHFCCMGAMLPSCCYLMHSGRAGVQ